MSSPAIPSTSESAELEARQAYRGNCHCGRFVYELRMAPIRSVMTCNCSICTKRGYQWVFPPDADAYRVVVGSEAELTTYTFGPRSLLHLFCPTCGTGVVGRQADGSGCAINARTIQNIDLGSILKHRYDGLSLGQKYVIPHYTGIDPDAFSVEKQTFTGSCHCGAVRVALHHPPLDDKQMIKECDCSICQRHAYIWLYPRAAQLAFEGEENLEHYSFGTKMMRKTFCRICGIPFTNDFNELSHEQVATLPGWAQHMYQNLRPIGFRPFNLRVLNEFDFATLKPTYSEGAKTNLPAYVNP